MNCSCCSADTFGCKSHIIFSSWILKHFLLKEINTLYSFFSPLRFPLPLLFSSFPVSGPTTWHCGAGRFGGDASRMEMRCRVARSQEAADWTLAWMVQQMFADFFKIQISPEYWLKGHGCRRSSSEDTCSINPTWCAHVFGRVRVNESKQEMEYSVCSKCASVCVHVTQEGTGIEK